MIIPARWGDILVGRHQPVVEKSHAGRRRIPLLQVITMFRADSQLPTTYEDLLHLFTDCVLEYALYTVDSQGNISSWNRGAERLFGYSAAEIRGRSFEALYPPESIARHEPLRELAAAKEQKSYEADGWRIRKDGSRMGVYVVMKALRGEQSEVRGFAVATRDITEQQRSIQELQDQKRRLRSILDTAVDAVVIIDERGMIESFNPAGERLFGYTVDEVIGQNVRMLMPEPYAREHTSYIQRYLRTGDAKVIGVGREVQARRKDGSLFPADLAVSAFHDVKPLFTGILRDISDRKTMEANVLHIAEEEQRRIGQELHDDAQQQLAGLTMIARHAADALAALAAQDPRLCEVQVKVERVVKGLRETNQSLRQIARDLVPLQVEAHGLCDSLANLTKQIRELHDVDCRFSADNGIQIDDNSTASHLYRITQEAVNNALKHGGAKTIEIRLRSEERLIVLEIADDGIGIADPGEQIGRGLQIMAYRAGLIGGLLTVRRRETGGTLVSCRLPTKVKPSVIAES